MYISQKMTYSLIQLERSAYTNNNDNVTLSRLQRQCTIKPHLSQPTLCLHGLGMKETGSCNDMSFTSVDDKHMMAACSSLASLSLATGRTKPAQYPCITASLQCTHKHNYHNNTNGPSFSAKSMACLPRRGYGGTKLWHLPVLVSSEVLVSCLLAG